MPPTTRKKGTRDYSDCEFRTLLTNLPPGIQQMLDRALRSFGTDVAVLPRWSGPVVKKDGSTVLEKDYFPHNPSIKDICCADGVAFVLYQSGVVDLGRNPDYFRARMMNGASMAGCYHWAHYYHAHDGNADVCYALPEVSNKTDPAAVDFRDWLPGDVFVYFNDEKGDPEGDHVNIYLGPFTEVVDGVDVGPVCHFFNSSIGTTDGNAFCTASPFSSQLAYCKSVNRSFQRVRVRAIEQLFRNQISAPIVLSDERPTPDSPPPAETAWRLAEAGASPYPIGRNLTWHEGIHLVSGTGLKNDSVEVFAPGELVVARFGERMSAGESSFVVARHRIVSDQVRLLPPPPVGDEATAAEKEADPAVADAKPLHSLYMQLAPLSTYLDDAHEIEPGIPALHDGTVSPLPPGKALAPAWLRRIWLERKPEPIDLVPDTAQLSLLALTRSGGTAGFTEIARPDRITARRRIPLSELRPPVTIDGAVYWLLPIPEPRNAGAWDQAIPPATVPRQRKLAYYNPSTGNTFDTPLNVPGSTPLLHRDDAGRAVLERVTREDGTAVTSAAGTLVRIQAHDTPGFMMASFIDEPGERDQYDYDEAERTLTFHENVEKITLFTTTHGEAEKRYFPDLTSFELVKVTSDRRFEVLERADTGARTRTNRAWLDLGAGVWMTDAEIAAAEKLLNDRDTALRTEIRQRLEAGVSCLAGVKISAKSGWELRDGHIVAAAEAPEGNLTIYRKINGAGTKRTFVEPPATSDAEHEQDVVFEIAPPPAEAAMYPLLAPAGRVQSAVFELMLATTVTGNNQADIDAVDATNAAKKPVVQKLLEGELVDLRSELSDQPELRTLRRERIGQMGDVAAPHGGFVKGVHFELFSGENVIDPAVTGASGDLQPVPKTPWLVYKDTTPDGFFSRDFVDRAVTLLREHAVEHGIDLRALDTAFGEDAVVQPAEWLEFCRHNHRALSRLITVHKPEWKTDWSAELTATSRGGHTTQAGREALASDVEQTNWWTGALSLDGITSDDVFFYHPLRFIEWLNTGIDFVLTGMAKKAPKVKVRPLEGGEEVELTADARDPSLFRFRTFVGEGGAKTEAPFRVTLENVATATPRFSVMVRRGAVRVVRLHEPKVEQDYASPVSSIDAVYAVPVRLSAARNGYLLADGDAHLEGCGYGETSVVFKVNYNVRIPGTVGLTMEGDASFTMGRIEISGATAASPPAGGRSASLTLTDGARIQSAVEASIVEGSRMYTIQVDLKTNTNEVDRSAKLVATFSGGDLPEEKRIEVSVATRTISISASSAAKGEDVAKLQLYLSQLHAADDQPCLRPAGKGPVSVDGSYGKELASAIWRFVYTFGRTSDWASGAWPIQTTKSDGSAVAAATQAEIASVSPSTLEGATPTAAIAPAGGADDLFAKRVGRYERRYDHYPVIGKPLVQEVVKRFHPPFVLPHVDLFFENTVLTAAAAGVTVDADWNRDGRIGKSTLLPISGDFFVFRVSWSNAAVERDGDMQIVFELPDASAYRFAGTMTARFETTLRRALQTERFVLFSSQSVSAKAADNVLVIKAGNGRELGKRQLHGSRDLTKAQADDGCRDAAWMQHWLSQIPDQDAPIESVYKNTVTTGRGRDRTTSLVINGKWNTKCVEALTRFQRQYAPASMAFPDLAAALRTKAQELVTR